MPQTSPPRRLGRSARSGAAVAVLLAVAGYLASQYVTGSAGRPGCVVVSAEDDGAVHTIEPEQAANAAAITAVGTARGLPERAVTIALATALQESGLRNIDYGDRDSVGLFQQRPSQGWGSPEEIMEPTYAAGRFYDHLAEVPGYTRLPLTVAAQRVQRSAFPEAYAKHEPEAALLAAALTGRTEAALTCRGLDTDGPGDPEEVRAALARDFGPDVLRPTGTRTDPVGGTPAADGSAGASPGPSESRPDDPTRRTVTLPVGAYPDGGGEEEARRRGWQVAHWAVANASALGIERVSYADREWAVGSTDPGWRPATSAEGTPGEGSSPDGGDVRIVVSG
ncbi:MULTISPECIES: heavy metal transporter [unclassified Streptomyces]|uniref:heavy metal transporter n=1 Tax=unclassified Streptomyces TaxID=2593676 RepID=UPI001F5BC023|nr:heavy metal transporter [Streptomyces sp. HSG2]